MAEVKPLERKEWLKLLNIRMVIVEVQPGETEEDAWSSHLSRRPEDRWPHIRVFHRQPPKGTNNKVSITYSSISNRDSALKAEIHP